MWIHLNEQMAWILRDEDRFIIINLQRFKICVAFALCDRKCHSYFFTSSSDPILAKYFWSFWRSRALLRFSLTDCSFFHLSDIDTDAFAQLGKQRK